MKATVLALAAAAVVLRRRLVLVRVHGMSMEPTLRAGSRILVRRTRRVRRGAVVVLRPPGDVASDPSLRLMIKRVSALPGDPLGDGTVVPAGRLVVAGDNPARSYDSRQLGLFDTAAVLGVALRRSDAPSG